MTSPGTKLAFKCLFRKVESQNVAWMIGYGEADLTSVLSCAIIDNGERDVVGDWKAVSRMVPYNLSAVGLLISTTDEGAVGSTNLGEEKVRNVVFNTLYSSNNNFSSVLSDSFLAVLYSGTASTAVFRVDYQSNKIEPVEIAPTFVAKDTAVRNHYFRATMKNQAIVPVLPHGGDNVAVFEEYIKNKISNFLGAWPSSSSDAAFVAVLPNNQILHVSNSDDAPGKRPLASADYFADDVPQSISNMAWKSHQFRSSLRSAQRSAKGKKGGKGKGKGKKKGGGGGDDRYQMPSEITVEKNPILKNTTILTQQHCSKVLNLRLRKSGVSNEDVGIFGNGVQLPNGLKHIRCRMNGEALVFVGSGNKTIDMSCADGLTALARQFEAFGSAILENEKVNKFSTWYQNFHFAPAGMTHPITLVIDMDDDNEKGEEFSKVRLSVHRRFAHHIVNDRPLFRLGCAVNFFESSVGET